MKSWPTSRLNEKNIPCISCSVYVCILNLFSYFRIIYLRLWNSIVYIKQFLVDVDKLLTKNLYMSILCFPVPSSSSITLSSTHIQQHLFTLNYSPLFLSLSVERKKNAYDLLAAYTHLLFIFLSDTYSWSG